MDADMQDRVDRTGVKWADEGDDYFSGIGQNMSLLAYIAVPEDHPILKLDMFDIDLPVNGGITFRRGRVLGWDYSHYMNTGSPETDIPAALEYLRNYKE